VGLGIQRLGGGRAELSGSMFVGCHLEGWRAAFFFKDVVGRLVRVSVRGLLPGALNQSKIIRMRYPPTVVGGIN